MAVLQQCLVQWSNQCLDKGVSWIFWEQEEDRYVLKHPEGKDFGDNILNHAYILHFADWLSATIGKGTVCSLRNNMFPIQYVQ